MKDNTIKFSDYIQKIECGYYKICGESDENNILFAFYKKPIWLHRMCSRILLGWVWIDR